MSRRRVVVTGMGIVSPVGSTIDSAWSAICNGRSGINVVSSFDAGHMKTHIAGEVVDFDVANYLTPRETKRLDDFVHYGFAASVDALCHSRRNLVPGRKQRQPGLSVSDTLSDHDSGLAKQLAAGRFPVLFCSISQFSRHGR